jgi:hypothetical protein
MSIQRNIFFFALVTLCCLSCKKEEQPEGPYVPPNNTIQYSWAGQKFVIFQYDSINNDTTVVAANDTMNFISQHDVICRDSTARYAVYEPRSCPKQFLVEPPFPFGQSQGIFIVPTQLNVGDTFSFMCVKAQIRYWIYSRRVQ